MVLFWYCMKLLGAVHQQLVDAVNYKPTQVEIGRTPEQRSKHVQTLSKISLTVTNLCHCPRHVKLMPMALGCKGQTWRGWTSKEHQPTHPTHPRHPRHPRSKRRKCTPQPGSFCGMVVCCFNVKCGWNYPSTHIHIYI